MPTSTAIEPVVPPVAAHGIRVTTVPAYAAEHSDPEAGKHVFTYTITIHNDGDGAAKLVSRHWVIIDGNGKREDVRGPGVVGQTPRVEPGASYEYQSFCPLKTRWGTMEGSYHMRRDDGTEFDVAVPRFVLHVD